MKGQILTVHQELDLYLVGKGKTVGSMPDHQMGGACFSWYSNDNSRDPCKEQRQVNNAMLVNISLLHLNKIARKTYNIKLNQITVY